MINRSLSQLRREYGERALEEQQMPDAPLAQFHLWFEEAVEAEHEDPSAMLLSTVDASGHPDARVVLLKDIIDEQFVFYTNYDSAKAHQIQQNQWVALTFYWPHLVRQVRIRGQISRLDSHLSDLYFASRPYESQLGALVSPQSHVIPNRTFLEDLYEKSMEIYPSLPIKRPDFWGGYRVEPVFFEFWQGRNSRLHDRIQYTRHSNGWDKTRVAP